MFHSILDKGDTTSVSRWPSSEINSSATNALTLNITFSKTVQTIRDWGPKRDPLYIVIPITIIYVSIFFLGVIGNISTCIVIARNKCMHTATNYYLFSLAVSDLLLLISGLPPEIYSVWSKYPYIFGEAFCVLQGFAAETSANATVLTITAFTVERYVAICYPFLSHTMSKLSRAIKFILGIWIIAMFLAVPQAISFGIVHGEPPGGEDRYVCSVKRIIVPHAFEISTFVFFVFPMSVITVLYVLIGLQLHRSTVRPSRSNSSMRSKRKVCKPTSVVYATNLTQAVLVVNGENEIEKREEECRKNVSRNAQATKHVVKMLVAVVVAFFLCWAPFHAQRLLAIYGAPTTENMITAFRVLTYASGVLYFLSTTINPVLYHIMSHRFRGAFKDTFNRFFRRRKRPAGARCYSTLSQANSHSNTDSCCSRQNSMRYLSRRPLVVSFKRKPQPAQLPRTQTTAASRRVVFDVDLQEALDRLRAPPPAPPPDAFRGVSAVMTTRTTTRLEDIEIFQEQQLRVLKRGTRREATTAMTKSRTAPEMPNERGIVVEGGTWRAGPRRSDARGASCSRLELINDGVIIQVT